MDLKLHQLVELKKAHPCGSRNWEVLRVGMDVKLRCQGCGHEVMAPRRKIEKSIKRILSEDALCRDGDRPAAGGGDAADTDRAVSEPVRAAR